MNAVKPVTLGILTILISVTVGKYAAGVLLPLLFDLLFNTGFLKDAGDVAQMLYSLALRLMVGPSIAGGLAALISCLGWRIMTVKIQPSMRQGYILVAVVVLITVLLSMLWAAYEYFFLL